MTRSLSQTQIDDLLGIKTRWVSQAEAHNDGVANIYDEARGEHIARVFAAGNGHTIAAAPLMLETLRDLRNYLEMKLIGDLREYHNNEIHAVIMTTRRKIADITAAIACATNGIKPADRPALEIEQ